VRRLFAGIVVCTLCLSGCSKKAAPAAIAEPQLVKTMVISGSNSATSNLYSGRVGAGEEANLMFDVAGIVTEILVKEGQKVTKGAVLAKLNPRDYQNRYDESKAQYELAKVNLNRFAILLKSNTVSRSEYDQKLADYKVAEASLDTAKKALEDTHIKAPYDGIIAKRFVEEHESVLAKQPILLIQDLTSIEVLLNIPEQDMAKGRKVVYSEEADGKKILRNAVSFSTLPGKTFDASLREFATRADPKTQTYQVRLTVSQIGKDRILPGMTAQVRVTFNTTGNPNLTVPVDAVAIDAQGKNYVWVIDTKSMTVHKKIVQVGVMKEASIIITGGLESNQTIVIAGVNALQDNMKVKILKDKIGS